MHLIYMPAFSNCVAACRPPVGLELRIDHHLSRKMADLITRYSKNCVKLRLKNRQNKDLNDNW